MTTPPKPRFTLPEDAELGHTTGWQPDLWPAPALVPPPAALATQPEPSATPAADSGGRRLLPLLVGLVVGPPLFLLVMVWFVGITALPTYFRYFESPTSSGSAG
jgi:hypothetical protein